MIYSSASSIPRSSKRRLKRQRLRFQNMSSLWSLHVASHGSVAGLVTEKGLSDEQVETAREEYGSNILSHRKEAGIVKELLQRCRNPLVIQLLVICGVSLLMGDVRAATVVGAMVVLSVVLAYVQEHRSSKAVEKLVAMVQTNSLVIRDGKEDDIPIAEIVPGDIVTLQAGALIPADLRLISAKDFS